MNRDTHSHGFVVISFVVIPDLLVFPFHQSPDLPIVSFAEIPLEHPFKLLFG
jgi:hypothetical protein